MKAYVITWKYPDNSNAGIFKIAYQSELLAKQVLETIEFSGPAKMPEVQEIEIVMGDMG